MHLSLSDEVHSFNLEDKKKQFSPFGWRISNSKTESHIFKGHTDIETQKLLMLLIKEIMIYW
jgi:hypothetical protein